ncbi:jg22409 [Pararge aegeria aegeria]|uniref:Jg22409 protein n=1 Tax=Pararge aegeria aegeria TaxID=348720 RepID=A0A8S4QXX1_9NEOP|nr:jg22409 [Pararge aegeria aegeria]
MSIFKSRVNEYLQNKCASRIHCHTSILRQIKAIKTPVFRGLSRHRSHCKLWRKSWDNSGHSLGLVLAFLQDQDQEQDRVFLARPSPRLTVQDLSKNKT